MSVTKYHTYVGQSNMSLSVPVVQDAATSLESRGVAHVKNLLPVDELLKLRTELQTCHNTFTSVSENVTTKSDSAGLIREIAGLVNYSSLFARSDVYQKCSQLASTLFGRTARYGHDEAIFKAPGGESVQWHQDQVYSKYDRDKQCVSIWIPLQDTDTSNGGMEYVVNSKDRLLGHERVSSDSFMYRVTQNQLDNAETISPVMKLGDVCVHTPLCVHRSLPNSGADLRIAWILQFNKYGVSRFLRWNNLKQYIPQLSE